MAMPRPVPSTDRRVGTSSRSNGSNKRDMNSFDMPMPSSSTMKRIRRIAIEAVMAGRLKRKTALLGMIRTRSSPVSSSTRKFTSPARLGVFHRVAQQVDKHLAHAHLVAHHQPVLDLDARDREREVLRIGLRPHDGPERFHHRANIERPRSSGRFGRSLSCSYPARRSRGSADGATKAAPCPSISFTLSRSSICSYGDVDESHDGRQRRADVVRHVRQERRLRLAGILRRRHRRDAGFPATRALAGSCA